MRTIEIPWALQAVTRNAQKTRGGDDLFCENGSGEVQEVSPR